MSSRLNKVILINSYLGLGVNEINVNNHTQILGTNTAGKTTFLKTIPIFYGKSPSELVKKSSVTLSFQDFYLKYDSSYIIYEYITAFNKKSMVVVSSTSSGDKIRYRFVESGFNIDDFVHHEKDGSLNAKLPLEVLKSFQEKNIEHSKYLNQKEYKSVIQNVFERGSSLRIYSKYSIVKSNEEFKHIENMLTALITGKFEFKKVKNVIVDAINGGVSTSIDLSMQDNLIQNWSVDYQSCLKFEENKKSFDQIIKNNKLIKEYNKELKELYIAIEYFYKENALELKEKEELLSKLNSELSVQKKEWEEKDQDLLNTITELNAKRKQTEKDIEIIKSKHEFYINSSINDKINSLDELDYKYKVLKNLKNAHEALISEQSEIENKYNVLISKIEISSRDEQGRIKEIISDYKSKKELQKKSLESDSKDNIAKIKDGFSNEKMDLRESRSNIESEIKIADSKRSSIEPSFNLKNRKDSVSNEIESAKKELNSTIKESSKLNKLVQKLKDELNQTSSDIKNSSAKEKEINERLQVISQYLDPNNGTLLRYLETHFEGWKESSLGKVLDERLLTRTDLSPKLTEDNLNTLYGLVLDLDSVDSTEENSSSMIEEQDSLSIKLEAVKVKIRKNSKLSEKLTKEISTNENEIALLNAKEEKIGKEIESLEDELKIINSDIDIEVSELSSELDDKIADMKDELSKLERKLSKIESTLTSEVKKEEKSLRQKIVDSDDGYQKDISALEDKLDKEVSKNKDSIEDLKKEKNKAFEENGIDVQAVKDKLSEISDLEEEIEEIESYKKIVDEYKTFIETRFSNLDEMQLELEELIVDISKNEENRKSSKNKYDEERSILLKDKTSTSNRIAYLGDIQDEFSVIVESFGSVYGSSNKVPNESLQNLDFKALATRFSKKKTEVNILLTKRLEEMRDIENLIHSYTSSNIAKFWKENCDKLANSNSSDLVGDKVDVLDSIVNELLPQLNQSLIQEAKFAAQSITNFYESLKNIKNKISAFGRKLSKAVAGNTQFENIDNLEAKMESTVDKFSYWNELNNFCFEYEKWSDQDIDKMPHKEFAESMIKLASYIYDGKISSEYSDMFNLVFEVVENGNRKIVKSDSEMSSLSSNGMNFIIMTCLFVGLINIYRNDADVTLHWPTDELGKLKGKNILKLLNMMKENNIIMISALPDPKGLVHFPNVYEINKKFGIFTNRKKEIGLNPLDALKNKEIEVM